MLPECYKRVLNSMIFLSHLPKENVRDILLAISRALDRGNSDEARNRLRSVPLVQGDRAERLVAVGLWKQLANPPQKPTAPTSPPAAEKTAVLDRLGAAAADRRRTLDAHEAIPVVEELFGPEDAAAIVASTLWDRVLEFHPYMFVAAFELFFRAGGERCLSAMEAFIGKRSDYVPDYWHFILLIRSTPARYSDFAALAQQLLQKSGRQDLAPLFDIYLKQTRQAPVGEIMAAACALEAARQRLAVVEHIINTVYTRDELPVVVASFSALVGDSKEAHALVAFMQARLAIAERRWRDAVEYTEAARTDYRVSCAADLLRALALTRLDQIQHARTSLDGVIANPHAHLFQHAMAAHIRVTTELSACGLPLPEDNHSTAFAPPAAQPTAQSLWIGRRLRWIEQLCISSYLAKGWRFHLYVYDEPENVPDGCELHDAAAIIPRADVFVEGQGSAVHAGSIGAFSDLFRYRLLSMRGGLWTDTDVINFKTYDPSGRRFVCTEFSDAGVATVTGSIMAAPAGDEFAVRAYDRARALLADRNMFFTRIGPYLLAELVLEMGIEKVEIMPPQFLGPITPMNAALLFQPFNLVAARKDFQQLINIHAYTEIYRVFGFALDQPPDPESFIGRLYADQFPEAERPRRAISS
jgi:hypothetical protein